MVGRVRVERHSEIDDDWNEVAVYRLQEQDGTPVICWAPGLERDESEPLDKGGYAERSDADAFRLGVDRWRAGVGLISETVADIDAERAQLDRRPSTYQKRTQAPPPSPNVQTYQRTG